MARKRRWSGAPLARACVLPGSTSTLRKARPYSGYENFDFEIPVGGGVSDCYTRVMLKVEELRQSLRILEQCLNNMPEGPFKADHR